MRRFLLGCTAAAAACLASGAHAASTAADELVAIGRGLSEGKCDVPRIRKLLASKGFVELSGPARSLGYSALGVCDNASLSEAAEKATAQPDPLALAWSLRFLDLASRKSVPGALDALRNAVDRKGDGTLLPFQDEVVLRFARDLQNDPVSFQKYAAELDRAGWTAADPYYNADVVWSRYAGQLAEAGDLQHAWRVASRVTDPSELLRMTLDKRFDEVVAVDPLRFDVLAAAQAQMARARVRLDANALEATGVTTVTGVLRMQSRQDEALALLDTTLARQGGILDSRGNEARNWLINDRALVLFELGRVDDGLAAMKQAAGLTEYGVANVSQVINLSGLQLSAGRFDETLKTLAAAAATMKTNASPYGRMWIAAKETCAYHALGREADAARSLAVTAANASDNATARAEALLCIGDLDGLASEYKARLADPSTRPAALVRLSTFKRPALTAFEVELDRKMQALRERPDIRAAVAAVGRTKDFPFQLGSLSEN